MPGEYTNIETLQYLEPSHFYQAPGSVDRQAKKSELLSFDDIASSVPKQPIQPGATGQQQVQGAMAQGLQNMMIQSEQNQMHNQGFFTGQPQF